MKVSKRVLCLFVAIVMAISCMAFNAFADGEIQIGVSFVNADALRLRSGPSMSSSVVDLAYEDEVVVITGQIGEWYHVIYNLQDGYMHSDYLNLIERENVELGYGRINGDCVNIRRGPSTDYSIVTQVYEGDSAYIIGINCGWYKVIVDGITGYVRSDLLDLTEIPYENRSSSNSPRYFRGGYSIGTVPSVENVPNSSGADSLENNSDNDTPEVSDTDNGYTSWAGQRIADTAKQYLGTPYVWGGASPSGFDCSGLVQYVARSCGYSIARTADRQYNYGTYVDFSDLQPGDIVFFANTYTSGISHVGIYIGDGDFVHSPGNGSSVKISNLYSGYYTYHYFGARRLG